MNHANHAVFNNQVLIAVDESANAEQAVRYVGHVLGKTTGFEVTILHIIPDPEEDYFPEKEEKDKYLDNYRERIGRTLEKYRRILLDAGFPADGVATQSTLRYCPSMAECILNERGKKDYGTIVVGRQGISRKEAFLFGSVSSKIVNHAKDCAVWVVG
ncbi:universal stress protein [Desulfosarcina sp.]|uniref:universal stress protein n=1 Tax=Desulfosarcina sp. TaxID=2027861 RepID=UPI0039706D01